MKSTRPEYIIRIPASIYKQAIDDLKRPHPFAFERVGFFSTSVSRTHKGRCIATITQYHSLEDNQYINDQNAGAVISSESIRQCMQRILKTKKGCFHVHLHNHSGKPSPSFTDLSSLPSVARSFFNTNPDLCSGYIILSKNSFYVSILNAKPSISIEPERITVIGYPMSFAFKSINVKKSDHHDRQTFLGENLEELLEGVRVGIVGLGGGGSHIVQQLAHIGIKNYILFDDDIIERSNLNRLIGGWDSDVAKKSLKVNIAKRLIKKILPKAVVNPIVLRWQNNPEELQQCDIVIGCMDAFTDREQLERECRRFLIPYIDIGMDVFQLPGEAPHIAGQVILSMPGLPCMRCMQFITEEKLAVEAGKYGVAGNRPQVVWPNGVLASSAIGIFIDLITGWTKQEKALKYLTYDGNSGVVVKHPRLTYTKNECSHFCLTETGAKIF